MTQGIIFMVNIHEPVVPDEELQEALVLAIKKALKGKADSVFLISERDAIGENIDL